jgi:hypothetical protein
VREFYVHGINPPVFYPHHAFLKQRTVLCRNVLYRDNLNTVKSYDFTMRDVKIKKLRDILIINDQIFHIENFILGTYSPAVRGWESPIRTRKRHSV